MALLKSKSIETGRLDASSNSFCDDQTLSEAASIFGVNQLQIMEPHCFQQ
jgi:hypothetical protein